jgi:hypothetical protein
VEEDLAEKTHRQPLFIAEVEEVEEEATSTSQSLPIL